ncbi:MAG: YfhO family protein [Saprospiraceae bacterium]|nr:YfhO family protein [Candidatus Vicinibacter affinis]
MNKFNLKKLFPHFLMIFGLWVVSALYFLPAFKGKVLQQGDIQSWEAMAHEGIEYNKTHDDVALWSNSMFGGMPMYQTAMPMQGNLLRYIQNIPYSLAKSPVNTFFGIMLFTYLALLLFGVQLYIAALGGILVALSTGNMLLLEAGHMTKLLVMAYAGLTLAGIWLVYHKKLLLGLTVFGFGFALQVMNNHVQMSYYILLGAVPLFIIYLIERIKSGDWVNFLKANFLLGLVAFLGLCSSATMMWTTQEYVKQTMRGGSVLSSSNTSGESSNKNGLEWDYAMNWSNGWVDLCATLIPGVAGGANGERAVNNSALKSELKNLRIPVNTNTRVPTYWGSLPFTGGPFYFGIVLVFFFILGCFLIPGKTKWWFALSLPLLCLLSLGKNFEILNRILFDYLPYYNKFRAPSSVLSIASIYCTVFGVYTIGKIFSDSFEVKALKKSLYYTTGILSVFCIFFWLMGPGSFDLSKGQTGEEIKIIVQLREAMMTGDALRALVLIILAGGAVYFYNIQKINKYVFVAIIAAISLFDLFSINSRYITQGDFVKQNIKSSIFEPREVDKQILADKNPGYRVLDNSIDTYNNSFPSYFHHTIGGYHPAKLRRYQDLIDRCIDEERNKMQSILQTFNGNISDSNFISNMNQLQVLNMLNTKYLIFGEKGKEVVLPNPSANGAAWFVKNIEWVDNADEEINLLMKRDLKQTAILHNEWKDKVNQAGDGNGTIQLISYEPNIIKYQVETNSDQLAVLSEIWYGPNLGWTAKLNEKEIELFRVNYALRGVQVSSGKSELVLEFKPKAFYTGEIISYCCSSVLILLLLFSFWNMYKKSNLTLTE